MKFLWIYAFYEQRLVLSDPMAETSDFWFETPQSIGMGSWLSSFWWLTFICPLWNRYALIHMFFFCILPSRRPVQFQGIDVMLILRVNFNAEVSVANMTFNLSKLFRASKSNLGLNDCVTYVGIAFLRVWFFLITFKLLLKTMFSL